MRERIRRALGVLGLGIITVVAIVTVFACGERVGQDDAASALRRSVINDSDTTTLLRLREALASWRPTTTGTDCALALLKEDVSRALTARGVP